MTLLVVDPDDATSSALTDSLAQLGFTVSRIPDVTELAESVARERPELVLCPYRELTRTPLALAESHPGARPDVAGRDRYAARCSTSAELLEALRIGVHRRRRAERSGHRIWRSSSTRRSAAAAARTLLAPSTAEDARTRAQLREFQRDQRAGRYIQMGMLPPSPMAIDRYRLRHKLFPSLMLSGDFVDYFRITDRHFAFYMADVSGHGASSAFVTVLLKNFSRRLRREYRPKMLKAPGEILAALNRELLDNQLDKHVAIFIGVIDLADDTLAYANGGHFPAAILCDDGGCRYLEVAGKPVGLFEGVSLGIEPGSR